MAKIFLCVWIFSALCVVGCQPEEVIVMPATQAATEISLPAATPNLPTSVPFEQSTALPTQPSNPAPSGPTATYDLPVTRTLPPITLVFPPTATAEPCVPHADWAATYTIQPGDTLFGIASLYSITTAELQTANCLTNANQIFSGTDLRVPFDLTPTAPATN